MNGVRRLDRETVLETVTETFREKGFAGTSLFDIEQVTGLKRSSLYHAFSSKAGLYAAALTSYQERTQGALLRELDHPDVGKALKNLFALQIARQAAQARPLGCLATNSSAEVGNHGDEVDDRIRGLLEHFDGAIEARLARGVEDGQLDPDTDVAALAKFFTAVSRSIPLLHRTTSDVGYIEQVARSALLVLRRSDRSAEA